ncbi:MAG: hypothetical protein ACYCOU_06280 [Sulfobacillus sp.]
MRHQRSSKPCQVLRELLSKPAQKKYVLIRCTRDIDSLRTIADECRRQLEHQLEMNEDLRRQLGTQSQLLSQIIGLTIPGKPELDKRSQ